LSEGSGLILLVIFCAGMAGRFFGVDRLCLSPWALKSNVVVILFTDSLIY
jgi:hypothetical protein